MSRRWKTRTVFWALAVAAFLTSSPRLQAQDDTPALWKSPTAGPPLSLSHAPQGAQCHIIIRPTAIWNHVEAQRTVRALGPELARWLADWATSRSLELPSIQGLQFSLIQSSSRTLETVAVLEMVEGKRLPTDWKGRREKGRREKGRTEHATGTYYDLQRSPDIAWVPGRPGSTIAVIGSPDAVVEIATRSAIAPVLRREIEQLRKQSDADRMLTILVSPQFLRSNMGQFPLATKHAMKFVEDLWNDDAQAIACSAHLVDDELFAELKFVGTYESHQGLPNRIQQAIGRYVRHASSDTAPQALGGLASRWPQMVEFVSQHLRVANDGDVTIVNVTLPATAAHNLTLGSSLFVQRRSVVRPNSVNPTTAKPTTAKPTRGTTSSPSRGLNPAALVAVLKTRIDFNFAQQSLEFALRDLQDLIRETVAEAAAFEIQIDGRALRADGITRNQQISNFQAKNRTVAQVLTQLVREADPALAGAAPDAQGTLIWAAGQGLQENEGGQVVLITTAIVAQRRGYRIPRDFRNR